MADVKISDLDPEKVAQIEAFLVAFVKDQFTSLDLSEGTVLRNILIRIAAILRGLDNEEIEILRNSMSVLAIEADPSAADDAMVDAIMSNFRLTRDPGALASGLVTIVILNNLTTQINVGTIFTANGLAFEITQSYVGVTDPAAVLTSQQRLITRRNDGTYSFTVPVVATQVGEAYMIRQGNRFEITPPPAGFIDATATQDFTGGRDAETNQELIAQFKLALAPQVFSGRAQINSLLFNADPNLKATSIIGFGQAEMLRDRNNIFATSTGGKVDIYARTQALPETRIVRKTATLIDVTGIWQVSVTRDDYPGFYSVNAVLPLDAPSDEGSLNIVEDIRGLDLTSTSGEFVPYIGNLIQGAYSRYQTAIVRFLDDDVPDGSVIGFTREYDVTLLGMPNIDGLQDLASSDLSRNPSADYLVRAPIPAFAAVALTVQYKEGTPVPDADAIKNSIAAAVNAINFTLGRLPSSIVYDAAHNAMSKTGTMVVSPIDLRARIRQPDGEIIDLQSFNEIDVPDDPDVETTANTVVFYLPASAIDLTIEKVTTLSGFKC